MAQHDLDRAAGELLRQLRKARAMSQEELAMAAEFDQSALSKVERLGPAAVGWVRFCRVADALGHEAVVTFRPKGSA